MQALDRAPLIMSHGVLITVLLLCFLLSVRSELRAQNGITAAQVAGTSTGAGTGIDAMWADNNDQRWKMNNNNNGGQDVAAWACPTELGGIVYAGTAVSGVDAESCLSLSSSFGVPLIAGSSAPQWLGTSSYMNLRTSALVSEFTNDTTGTGLLVFLTNASGTAEVETALTSTTQGIVGICIANCSTTAGVTVQIARYGIASCTFDGATTAGDYVMPSTSTAGDCRDTTSANLPTNGVQVVGRVLTTQSVAGSYAMLLYADGIVPPKFGTGVATALGTAVNTSGGVVTQPVANSSLANSSVTIDGDGTVFSNTSPGAVALGASGSLALNTQTANYVFAGPTTGSAATPTFRALVPADLQSSAAVIASNFTEDTGSLHTVMTIPSSGSIAAGAAFAGRCSGSYSFTTAAEKLEFELNASQTVQNGSIDVYIAFNNTTSSDPFLVDQSYNSAILSTNAAAAPATNFAWHIDFGGTWNATTAGTIALQATTSNTSGILNILAGARCIIF